MISNHSSFVPDTLSDLAGIVEILQYRRAAGTGSHRSLCPQSSSQSSGHLTPMATSSSQ
jgi:hypothetical protein